MKIKMKMKKRPHIYDMNLGTSRGGSSMRGRTQLLHSKIEVFGLRNMKI